MSRRTGESNLKAQVILECEPAALADSESGGMSKGTNPKNKQRVEKKAALRVQGKGRAGARMTRPKRVVRATPGTKPVELGLVSMKRVNEENTPAADSITVNPLISCVVADFPEQKLARRVGASFGNEIDPGLVTAADLGMDRPPRILLAESGIEENEVPEIHAAGKQTEITTDVEMRQSTEPQRRSTLSWLARALQWTRKHMGYRPARKRLRVCETVSLGEKRFVAVIEVDGEQFLVGGAASSVATLARLEPSPQFAEVLKRRWAQDPIQA